MLQNWKTTLAGVGVLLVLVGRLLQGDFSVGLEDFMLALAGLGLIAASDA
jgi:hypothetical protein